MILIQKLAEPDELLRYRKTKHSSYAAMPGDIKAVVKRSLVREQGGLCAYCMARLPEEGIDEIGNSEVTIEHWEPQNPSDGSRGHNPLDYKNMLAVCDGNRGCGDERHMTCDAARGNTEITVNPLKRETLVGISYGANGEIRSTNSKVNADLCEVLNLNCEAVSLPYNRRYALSGLQKSLNKKYPDKPIPKSELMRLLERYERPSDRKPPYVGILIDWIRKRLSRA